MKWLFDTNVILENVNHRADSGVISWVSEQAPDETAISAVTLAELLDGAALTPDQRRSDQLLNWINSSVRETFRDRILPVTTELLIDWLGLLRKLSARGRPQAAADILIASTARLHALILVTRNVSDFAGTGIIVYNPWTDETYKMEAP